MASAHRPAPVADLLEAPGWLADVALEPAATVVGYVIDKRGHGLPNARVEAGLSIERNPGGLLHLRDLGPSTHTDENGCYRLSGLPAGQRLHFGARQ